MTFPVFTAVACMVLLIACNTNNTRTTATVEAVYIQSRTPDHLTTTTTGHKHDTQATATGHKHDTQSTATGNKYDTQATATSSLLPDPHTIRNTVSDASSVSITRKKEAHDKMTERTTNLLHDVLGMSHEIRERKEGKLLNSTSESFVTMGLHGATISGVQDSVNLVTPKILNMPAVVAAKESGGPSLNALYVLYSLVNHVANTSDEYKPKSESKKPSGEHTNALYVLYSLVLYVANANELTELTRGSDHDKHDQASVGASWFSALHYEWEQAPARDGESLKFSPWTGYIIIAISVVAAVVLVVVAATCMTRYCRRPGTHASMHSKPVVRGVGSPSI